jgi:hypothetical protein
MGGIMYCPSCGTEVTKELNYCNRCGANLNPATSMVEQPVRHVSMNGPFWAMALMIVIGLGIIFASLNDLAKKEIHPAALTWLGIAGFATLLSVVSILMHHLSRMSGQPQTERQSRRKRAEKEVVRPAQLPPTRMEPVPSVTENTTRTFEPVERRRS